MILKHTAAVPVIILAVTAPNRTAEGLGLPFLPDVLRNDTEAYLPGLMGADP